MFRKILHANDGSEHAFHALALALAIAKQNNSELHMVSVEEIDYMPDFIEEVREEAGTGIRCQISSNLPKSLRLNCWLSAQLAIQRSTTD